MYMYQKFKLTREVNELSRKQLAIQDKKSRVTKNIERVQKRYTSLFQQLKTQAAQYEKAYNWYIQESSGLGMSGFNQYGFGGTTAFKEQLIASWFKDGSIKQKDQQGNETGVSLSKDDYQNLLTIQSGGGSFYIEGTQDPIDGFTKEQLAFYQSLRSQADYAQQTAQMQIGRKQQEMSMQVSIWQQAAEAQLELQQEQEKEPLEYEDTMLALEETSIKTQLELKKAELKECEEGVKDGIQSMGV